MLRHGEMMFFLRGRRGGDRRLSANVGHVGFRNDEESFARRAFNLGTGSSGVDDKFLFAFCAAEDDVHVFSCLGFPFALSNRKEDKALRRLFPENSRAVSKFPRRPFLFDFLRKLSAAKRICFLSVFVYVCRSLETPKDFL